MSDYDCPACKGKGEVECFHCQQDMDCEFCDGSGLDDAKLDVKAFLAAEWKLKLRDHATWDWIENGVAVGRMSKNGRVAYADFRRGEVKT